MPLQFFIEQVAIAPRNPAAAKKLLAEMGAKDWCDDHVKAQGSVFGKGCNGEPTKNEANLSFNYSLLAGKEFEILEYTSGFNWLDDPFHDAQPPTVSHFGMHCTAKELEQWRLFFKERGIGVAQEVVTTSHTNPAIAGKRSYTYVIFDTKAILGTDIKLIVRKDV